MRHRIRQSLFRSLATLLVCVVLIPIPARGEAARSGAVLGLPPLPQTMSAEVRSRRERLGQKLFFDTRLSADGKISCASCHRADLGFSDGLSRSRGHDQKLGTRNAPSLLNVAYARSLFWDGRAADLAHQARAPLTNPVEHALPDDEALLKIVRADAGYVDAFRSAYDVRQDAITSATVTDAIAVYERSLLSGGSPFDRYQYGGERTALSPAAVRGLDLFRGRAQCVSCHEVGRESALFTDEKFHLAPTSLPTAVTRNLSVLARKVFDAKSASPELERLIATEPEIAALGRFIVTRDPRDIGKFRTPSLRNVAITAPYMHDGSVTTLDKAVELELYGRDDAIRYPIVLTLAERADLVAFLESLTGVDRNSRTAHQ